jgi:hypothetical protein
VLFVQPDVYRDRNGSRSIRTCAGYRCRNGHGEYGQGKE